MAEATAGALQIVQTQQNLVGRTVIGGASAVTGQAPDKVQVGILEQIRDITLKSFRATTSIAKTLVDSLNFEKNKAARERDQAAELSKESGVKGESKGVGDAVTKAQGDAEKEGGKFVLFMGGLGKLFGTLLKPFKSLMNFIMKIGPVARLFTALGPIAGGLLRLTGIGTIIFLLVKYADEIVKALEPVITAIGKTFDIIKPVLTPIIGVLDFLIKGAINQVGLIITAFVNVFNQALEFIVGAISGVTDIVMGLFTLDFGRIGDGFKKIGDTILNALKFVVSSIIDAIPFVPKKFKEKIKSAIGVGEVAEEPAAETPEKPTGNVVADEKDKQEIETSFSNIKTLEVSTPVDPGIETPVLPPEVKPKTINMDQTTSAAQVAEVSVNAKPAVYTEEQKKKDLEAIEKVTKGGFGKRYSGILKDLQAQGAIIPMTRLQAQQVGIAGEEYEKYFAESMEKNRIAGIDPEEVRSFMIMQERYQRLNIAKSDIEMGAYERPEIMKNETGIDPSIVPSIKTPGSSLGEVVSQGTITVVNNQPTTVSSQNSVARSEVMVSRPNASIGDPYLDKQNYAVT